VLTNAVVWLAMTVILVVVPDTLERWMALQFARAIGWAVACGVWVVVVESEWKARDGPIVRFGVQFVLWLSAALVAIWISDAFRP
jgi:hypothetical protein